jgi:Flp pilus assembly protein TadG
MGFRNPIASLRRDTSGNALAICAAAMPLLIAGAGFAIDTVQMSLTRRVLQRAADSAALAGAYGINQNPSSTGTTRTGYATAAVTRDLAINSDLTLYGTPVVQSAPATGPYAGNNDAVRVQISAQRSLSFFSFFNSAPVTLTTEATAMLVRDGEFCLLALEDGTDPGVTASGNAEINIGCGISTNSRSTTAITAGGSSSVTATPIMAVGGVPASTHFNGSTLVPYAAVQSDPFANLPTPAPTNCVAPPDIGPQATIDIGPSTPGWNATDGSICLNGLDVKGNLNFPSGATVYINGGELSFGSQAHVTQGLNTGVTFILTSTNATSDPSSVATLNMNGGADLDINAPTSGPYSGVAFYEDRRAPIGRTIRYNGNSSSTINGAMYFPRSYFSYLGNASTAATCIQLIARRLEFSGSGSIQNSCPSSGNRHNFQATYVRLVG